MENFTPISAGIGGILIGVAASMLLLTHGRIAGISSILGGFFEPNENNKTWRILFFTGLIMGSSIYVIIAERFSEINLNPFQLDFVGCWRITGWVWKPSWFGLHQRPWSLWPWTFIVSIISCHSYIYDYCLSNRLNSTQLNRRLNLCKIFLASYPEFSLELVSRYQI